MLLLDEPLGALDLKLRQQMQIELKRIQREVGITFVYVTHDQEEALTMSDRIAVFNDGRIEQIGTPAEVYEHPATEFVAGFVGISNLSSATADGHDQRPEKITHARRRQCEPAARTSSRPRSRTSSTPGVSRATWSSSMPAASSCRPAEHRIVLGEARRCAWERRSVSPGCRSGLHDRELAERTTMQIIHAGGDQPSSDQRIAALSLAVAACSSAAAPRPRGGGSRRAARAAQAGTPASPSDREPSRAADGRQGRGPLNLIAWEGYPQPQWVKPFEEQTGCTVHAKYAGSSDEMVALMKHGGGGQYDMVSASGDADLRS